MFPVKTGNNYGKVTEPMSRVRPSVGPAIPISRCQSVARRSAKTAGPVWTTLGRNIRQVWDNTPCHQILSRSKVKVTVTGTSFNGVLNRVTDFHRGFCKCSQWKDTRRKSIVVCPTVTRPSVRRSVKRKWTENTFEWLAKLLCSKSMIWNILK